MNEKLIARSLRRGIVPGFIQPDDAIEILALTAPKAYVEIFGLLSARVFRNGGVEDRGLLSCRKVTTAFRDYIVDSLQDSTTYPMDAFKYHAHGTGTTAEANTQTALTTEVDSRATGTQIEGATANIFKSVGTVSVGGTYAITEHGLFSAAAAGTLCDRSLFTAINLVSGNSIEYTYQITFNAET